MIQYEKTPKGKVSQPDSGVISDDIIDDISTMSPSRPPPGCNGPTNAASIQIKNRRYDGIRFTQGRETVQKSMAEATIQLVPNGPVEVVKATIPYQYDDAAMSNIRRKDFHGVPMPLRDPEKEFNGVTRFPKRRRGDQLPQTNSTFGQAVQHESHRFGLTNALWPIENRDSKLADYQPVMSTRDPQEISRIYADPRKADLAFKIEDRRKHSCPFRSDPNRRLKLVRSSKARRAVNGV